MSARHPSWMTGRCQERQSQLTVIAQLVQIRTNWELNRPGMFGDRCAATYPEPVESLVMYGNDGAVFPKNCPTIHGDLPPKRRPFIWKTSKVIGVNVRWSRCSLARLPIYQDFSTSMAVSTDKRQSDDGCHG